MSKFHDGQKVRYIGPDTAGSALHGDVLLIKTPRLGGKYDFELIVSSDASRVGSTNTAWEDTLEALPSGGVMSPLAFRELGRERVHPDPYLRARQTP